MKRTRSLVGSLPTITDPATGRVYPDIAGADGDDTEELLARLGSETEPLTEEELDQLEADLVAEFDELADDGSDLERLTQVRDQIVNVRAARDTLAEEAAAREAEVQAMRDQIHAVDADEDDDEDDDEAEGGEEAEGGAGDQRRRRR